MPRRCQRAVGRGRRGETGSSRTAQTIQASHPGTDWACLTWREGFYCVINVSNRHQDRKVDPHPPVLLDPRPRLVGSPCNRQGVNGTVGNQGPSTGVTALPRGPEGLYLGYLHSVGFEALRLDDLSELVQEEVEPLDCVPGLLAVLVDGGQQIRGLVDRPALPLLPQPHVVDHGAGRLRGGDR